MGSQHGTGSNRICVRESWPWEAIEAGTKVVATGRGARPNQVNNSLALPRLECHTSQCCRLRIGVEQDTVIAWSRLQQSEVHFSLTSSRRFVDFNIRLCAPRPDDSLSNSLRGEYRSIGFAS